MSTAVPRASRCMLNHPALLCSACRHLFRDTAAWKQHRRTGVCNLERLGLDASGVWRTPRRVRVTAQLELQTA